MLKELGVAPFAVQGADFEFSDLLSFSVSRKLLKALHLGNRPGTDPIVNSCIVSGLPPLAPLFAAF